MNERIDAQYRLNNLSATLDSSALEAIAKFNGTAVEDGTDNNTSSSTNNKCKDMVRMALGEKFKVEDMTINETYEAWMENLDSLVKAGHISLCMKKGFISLNVFKRSEDPRRDSKIACSCSGSMPEPYIAPYIV